MLSFLSMKNVPDKAKDYLNKALALSPQLVFPFREEEISLYQWVLAQRPDDWKPRYYLGLILWSKGRVDEAKALLDKCDAADFAPLFLSRAMLYRAADPARAAADYEKAVRVDEKTWRNWHALIDFRMAGKQFDMALAAAKQAAGLFPAEVPIKVDLVKALMAGKLFAEAASVLDTIEALPFEGASEIQGLFAQTQIQLGLEAVKKGDWAGAAKSLEHSKEYPEKLGTGKPFDPDERAPDYFLGLIMPSSGRRTSPRPPSRRSSITP